jgi:glucose-1-phosphatase
MAKIKNVIFDLGGVLLDIDTTKTDAAFEQLGIKEFKNNYSLHKADSLFNDLETGKITETDFYNGIRNISQTQLTDAAIRDAWNALLLDFRTSSLEFLEQIAHQYNLYLLSNTNSIHITAFTEIFRQTVGKTSFDGYFNKAYYSCKIGLRKPEEAIYTYVLKDAGINPAETLFVDDLIYNITAAKTLGIQTHHLQPHERIEGINL